MDVAAIEPGAAPPPSWLTSAEVAIATGVDRATVASWCADGLLHALKVGDGGQAP
ncbi:MAG: hypothetical protein AVDCRST_MAG76-3315 [uncultured Acidimicrobiales bacterium]|uniref:Helix-turn-helix domain-containing protein n=1 Tax=uncultured Acidimicrobiales bacterium TaxID=310071 RepID=A0A6J4J6V6_9ACTN|nr:MAG: hypothetical protein AVDCRST_MAG76-3315 [uncultured Acidimicrobiales bacterium]